MRISSKAVERRLRFALAIVAVLVLHSKAYAADYYVDCSLLTDGVGTADAPWNNLATPSALTFMPGDVIALKRGTTCAGMLAPLGSGEPGAPITIGAYGSGGRPVIVRREARGYCTLQSDPLGDPRCRDERWESSRLTHQR